MLAITIGAALGLVIGDITRRQLNRLHYRKPAQNEDDVDETSLPSPGRRWWIPLILGLFWAWIGWLVPVDEITFRTTAVSQIALFIGWLTLAGVGVWLGAVDLDIQRLPDKGQLVLALVLFACGVAVWWAEPGHLLVGVATAASCGVFFLLLHVISRGNLGLGDVKLVATCGWWLGLGSVSAVFAGLLAACLLAVVYAIIRRARQLAFGPWLVAGSILALYVSAV